MNVEVCKGPIIRIFSLQESVYDLSNALDHLKLLTEEKCMTLGGRLEENKERISKFTQGTVSLNETVSELQKKVEHMSLDKGDGLQQVRVTRFSIFGKVV